MIYSIFRQAPIFQEKISPDTNHKNTLVEEPRSIRLPVELYEMIVDEYDLSIRDLCALCLIKPFSFPASRAIYTHIPSQRTIEKTMDVLKTLNQNRNNICRYVRSLELYFGHFPLRARNGLKTRVGETRDAEIIRCFRQQTSLVNNVLKNLPNLCALRLDVLDPKIRKDKLLQQCLRGCIFPHLEYYSTNFDIGPGHTSFLLRHGGDNSISSTRLSTLHLDSSNLSILDLFTFTCKFKHTFSDLTHLGWSTETPPAVIRAITRSCSSNVTEITLSQSLSHNQWHHVYDLAYRVLRTDVQTMVDAVIDSPGFRNNIVSLTLNFPLDRLNIHHKAISAAFPRVQNLWITDMTTMAYDDIEEARVDYTQAFPFYADYYKNLKKLIISGSRPPVVGPKGVIGGYDGTNADVCIIDDWEHELTQRVES